MGAENDKPTAGAAAAKRRKLICTGLLALAIGVVGALVDYWLGTASDKFIAFFHLVTFTVVGLAFIGWGFLRPGNNADLDNDIYPPNSGRM
jgi:hypothetical protein